MPKMCSGHQKHVFGRGWEGLGRFERFWEVSGELGRVWKGLGVPKLSNCHRKQLFGRVWEDLGGFGNAKSVQLLPNPPPKGNPGDPRGSQRVPTGARR